MQKPFTTVAVGIFAFVAATHACRIWLGWDVVIAGRAIPMWASYLGLILASLLSVMLWRESRGGKG